MDSLSVLQDASKTFHRRSARSLPKFRAMIKRSQFVNHDVRSMHNLEHCSDWRISQRLLASRLPHRYRIPWRSNEKAATNERLTNFGLQAHSVYKSESALPNTHLTACRNCFSRSAKTSDRSSRVYIILHHTLNII